MGGAKLLLIASIACMACGSDKDDDTGADGLGLRTCGLLKGAVFDVQVGRVMLAPADPDGNHWDSTQTDTAWKDDLREWRDLSETVTTSGTFRRDSFEDVEALHSYFESSLFVPKAAPDPVAMLYSTKNSGKRWDLAQTWDHLVGNTHLLDDLYLGRWTLDGDRRITLQISDEDAPESTIVGDLTITAVLAQSMANCGPMSLVRSDSEMRKQDTRIHAIELEIVSLD